MNLREWFRPPRHLLVMFCGITFVSAVTLGWLGWQLVRQDRALASQRSQERRENAAELAVASLEQQLSEVEEQLTALAHLPANDLREEALAYSQRLGGDSALLIFHADRIDAYPPAALVYYPVLPRVDAAAGDAPIVGIPQPLFQVPFRLASFQRNVFDVTADGQRFLVNTLVEGALSAPITWVLNWTAELEQ